MEKSVLMVYNKLLNLAGMTGDPIKAGLSGRRCSMKVVIIGFYPETAKDRIRGSFPCTWDVRIVLPEEVEQELTDADVLIPEHILIDDEILQKAPKLKLV
ncbi:MAG: hypothetical protein IJK38_13620, partial [Oscillospiraceae bacterium]|nr:hypothetical protein [Oscillospiraceae bacterium]